MEMHEASPALRITVFSYRWRVVYLFSEGFTVQDIATILHVGCTFLKKINQVVQSDFNCKLRRRSKTRHLDGMFILCTLLISFERSGKLTNKIPYQLIMLPFLCPVGK